MTTLKKIWAFLKTHWYIPVIIIIAIVLKGRNTSLLKIIDAQKESYDKQKAAIENAEKEKQEASFTLTNPQLEGDVIKIEITGEIKDLINLSDIYFILKPNKPKNISFYILTTKKIGNFNGKIKINGNFYGYDMPIYINVESKDLDFDINTNLEKNTFY